MLNFTGLFSILFLVSIVCYLVKITPEFDFGRHTVSHLGTFPKTKNSYLFTLLIYTFLRLIFFSTLFTRFLLWDNLIIVTAFIVAFGSFLATAFITLSRHQKVHSSVALISAIATCILIFSLGIVLLGISFTIGVVNIILANSMLWGSWILARKKGLNAYIQLFYITNVILWDSCMALFLLGILR